MCPRPAGERGGETRLPGSGRSGRGQRLGARVGTSSEIGAASWEAGFGEAALGKLPEQTGCFLLTPHRRAVHAASRVSEGPDWKVAGQVDGPRAEDPGHGGGSAEVSRRLALEAARLEDARP